MSGTLCLNFFQNYITAMQHSPCRMYIIRLRIFPLLKGTDMAGPITEWFEQKLVEWQQTIPLVRQHKDLAAALMHGHVKKMHYFQDIKTSIQFAMPVELAEWMEPIEGLEQTIQYNAALAMWAADNGLIWHGHLAIRLARSELFRQVDFTYSKYTEPNIVKAFKSENFGCFTQPQNNGNGVYRVRVPMWVLGDDPIGEFGLNR